jgi:preprotein translocase subunit YajC
MSYLPNLSFVAAMAQPPGQSVSWWWQILPFVPVVAIFYFLVLQPARQKQKKVQEFQAGLKVGDKVITTSGIYGQITKLGEQAIQVQIADKVRIDVARASVGGYQGQEPVVSDAGTN